MCPVSFLQGVNLDPNDAGKLVWEDSLAEDSLFKVSLVAMEGEGSKTLVINDSLATVDSDGTKRLVAKDSLVKDSLAEDSSDRLKLLFAEKKLQAAVKKSTH